MNAFNVARMTGNPPYVSKVVRANDPRHAVSIAYPEDKDTEFWSTTLSMRQPKYCVFFLSTDAQDIMKGNSGRVHIFGAKD